MAIKRTGQTIGIAIHHSVYKPAKNLAELKQQAKLFSSWHSKKSWAGQTKTSSAYPYISYHYLMATNGDILKVTDEKYVKYHASDSFRGKDSFNLHGIGICLTGNYQNDKPTEVMMESLVEFIRDFERRYKISARIRGHKETSKTATACPGTNIGTHKSGWLKKVIANVNDKKYPPKPKPPAPTIDYKKKYEVEVKKSKELSAELQDCIKKAREAQKTVSSLTQELKQTQEDCIGKVEGVRIEYDKEIERLEGRVKGAEKRAVSNEKKFRECYNESWVTVLLRQVFKVERAD